MKYFLSFLCMAFALFLVTSPSAHAAVYRNGSSVTIIEPIADDAFVSGTSLTFSAPIQGELFAAGSDISVVKKNSRSAFLAGTKVTVEEGVGYNLFAIGSTVIVKGVIEHDAYIAGADVVLDPTTEIKGDLKISGGRITLAGKINGDVAITAEHVTSSAIVGGNFTGEMVKLNFTGGSIGGDLLYNSDNDAKGLETVTIAGTQERNEPSMTGYSTPRVMFQNWLWAVLTALIAGATLLLLLPRKVTETQELLSHHWRKSLLTGLVALIVTPIAAFFIALTLVGLPIALTAIALYFIALYFASIISYVIFGNWVATKLKVKNNLWISLVIGAVLITLIRLIPVVGWMLSAVYFVALILPSFGASLMWYRHQLAQK